MPPNIFKEGPHEGFRNERRCESNRDFRQRRIEKEDPKEKKNEVPFLIQVEKDNSEKKEHTCTEKRGDSTNPEESHGYGICLQQILDVRGDAIGSLTGVVDAVGRLPEDGIEG